MTYAVFGHCITQQTIYIKKTGAPSSAHAINPGTVITTTHVHHKANQVMLASRTVAWCDFVVLH